MHKLLRSVISFFLMCPLANAQSAYMLYSDDIAHVNDMFIEPNAVWLATDSGVVHVTIQPEVFQFYLTEKFIRIKKFGQNVWAATETNGLYRFDGNSWLHYTRQNGLVSDSINDLDIDENGNIWLATDHGISRFDLNSFTNYKPFQLNDVLSIACKGDSVFVGNSSFNEPVKVYDGAAWTSLSLLPTPIENRTKYIVVDSLNRVISFGFNYAYFLDANSQWQLLLSQYTMPSKNGNSLLVGRFTDVLFVEPQIDTVVNPFQLAFTGNISALCADSVANSFWASVRSGDKTTIARYFITETEPYQEIATNALSAGFASDGTFFYDAAADRYTGLNIQGKQLIYAAGMLISGWQGNAQARNTSVKTYTNDGVPQWVMGPASSNRNSYSFFEKYNRVWRVTKTQIDNHKTNYANASYQIPEVILNWQGNGNTQAGEERFIAPFVDLNWNGIYEPLQGDYPEIRGDEAIFMVYNTVDGYSPYGHQNLGLECHTMAYGYDSLNTPLHNTLFVHQQLISKQNSFDTLLYGHFQDFDLGNPVDDVIAADSARNMIYVFNGDLNDEGPFGHGFNPPAAGFVMLSEPLAGAMATNNATANTDEEFSIYMLLRRKFIDGSPIRLDSTGGNGYLPGSSNPITNFQFNDRAGWLGVSPPLLQDKRFTAITEHTSVTQGDKVCLDFAYVYAPTNNPGNIFGPVDSLKNAVDYIHNFYQNQGFTCLGEELSVEQDVELPNALVTVYPNPANDVVHIQLPQKTETAQVKLYTIVGELVFDEKISTGNGQATVNLNANGKLAPGAYLLHVETGGQAFTEKLIIF